MASLGLATSDEVETAPESDEVEVSAILHPLVASGCSWTPEVISESTERMK